MNSPGRMRQSHSSPNSSSSAAILLGFARRELTRLQTISFGHAGYFNGRKYRRFQGKYAPALNGPPWRQPWVTRPGWPKKQRCGLGGVLIMSCPPGSGSSGLKPGLISVLGQEKHILGHDSLSKLTVVANHLHKRPGPSPA